MMMVHYGVFFLYVFCVIPCICNYILSLALFADFLIDGQKNSAFGGFSFGSNLGSFGS